MISNVRARSAGVCLSVFVHTIVGCASPVVTFRGAPVLPFACGGRVTDSAYLIGDAGKPKLPRKDTGELVDPVLGGMQRDVAAQVERLGYEHVVVLFLGDNVYWDGLPLEGQRGRRHAERVLEAQVAASAPAQAIFLLGNHDWDVEGPDGWERALAQRRFLARFAPRVAMHPPGGCAGPDVFDLGAHLRFVMIDPIGFGHLDEFPQEHMEHCPHRTVREAYLDLAASFEQTDGRHVVLAMHHPLITAGPHGGHYTWKQHLFPLTDFWPWAWFPLPVIGSAYSISRQLGITGTDATHRVYQRYVNAIYRAARPLVPSLFVGGHEHSLQLHRDRLGTYYAVSGAGSISKVNRVEQMDTIMMAEALPGYMRLDVHEGGAVGLTVFALTAKVPQPIYRHCLLSKGGDESIGPSGPR